MAPVSPQIQPFDALAEESFETYGAQGHKSGVPKGAALDNSDCILCQEKQRILRLLDMILQKIDLQFFDELDQFDDSDLLLNQLEQEINQFKTDGKPVK